MLDDRDMEKFFLKSRTISIENWQIGLLLIAAILGLLAFGALVDKASRNGRDASGVSKIALQIAQAPALARKIVKDFLTNYRPGLAQEQRFDGQTGFQRLKMGDDEALLLSRFDGDGVRSVVEIIDLENGDVLHRYEPDLRSLLSRSKLGNKIADVQLNRDTHNVTITHPILTEDGGLIFQGMNSPLAKIDVCSNLIWMVDRVVHHSLERDADGNYWSAALIDPPTLKTLPRIWQDNTIIQVSPDGKILFEKSVGEVFVDNDLEYLVYDGRTYSNDPLHLNDVQPVLEDGPHWRKGDLFLSLRHRSAILLYRPSTNKIVWMRQGPWMMQHDADIISDHEIAVFDNNVANLSWGQGVLGANNTIIYDFNSGEIDEPFADAFKVNEIRTITEGLSEILPDGDIFVEESNYGRMLKMNKAGDITWQYINRASDGRVYTVHWSRYIEKSSAHEAAKAAEHCKAAP